MIIINLFYLNIHVYIGPGIPMITRIEYGLGEVKIYWNKPQCCSSFIVNTKTLIGGSNYNITNTSGNQTSMTFTSKEFHQRSAGFVSIACKDADNVTGPFSREYYIYTGKHACTKFQSVY